MEMPILISTTSFLLVGLVHLMLLVEKNVEPLGGVRHIHGYTHPYWFSDKNRGCSFSNVT